jgi:hypothetical protein
MTTKDEIKNIMEDHGVILSKSTLKDYFRTIMDIINVAIDKDVYVFYVSITIPSSIIKNVLDSYGMSLDKVYFVDSTAYSFGSQTDKKTLVVESPTMLETLIIKIQYLQKITGNASSIIILDSANSLAIHNDLTILSEFFHVLITMLRPSEARLFIISVAEQLTPELSNVLELISDVTLEGS